jgi:Ran GTPase-activating protein (RanGAP) involved in mRNA processing and transport
MADVEQMQPHDDQHQEEAYE